MAPSGTWPERWASQARRSPTTSTAWRRPAISPAPVTRRTAGFHRVELTEKGERALQRLRMAVVAFDERLRDGLSEREVATLGSLLARLRAIVAEPVAGDTLPVTVIGNSSVFTWTPTMSGRVEELLDLPRYMFSPPLMIMSLIHGLGNDRSMAA
jgi:hypothetical protein